MASKKQVQRPALTQERQIRALRPESEPFEHSIKDSRGLLIRVSPKGKKVWVYRYRRRDTSKRERMTLGSYPDMALSDARTEVGVQRSLVEKHSSARDHRDELRDEARKKTAARVAAQKRSAFTVSALVEAYIQDVSTVGNDSYIASWRKVEKTLDAL